MKLKTAISWGLTKELLVPIIMIYAMFLIMTIKTDNEKMTIYFGPKYSIFSASSKNPKLNLFLFPLRKQFIYYDDVESVYPLSLHWVRDYFIRSSIGMSTGPNGDFAFVSNGRTGVRVNLKNGVEYTISTKKPDELTKFIKSKIKEG